MKPLSKPRRRSDIGRTILMVLAFVAVGLFLGNLIGRLLGPYRQIWKQSRENHDLEQKVRTERSELTELNRQVKLLKTPEGMLMEARRLGYLRPGERMIRYVEPENWPRTQAPEPPPTRLSRLKAKTARVMEELLRRKQDRGSPVAPRG
jgi:cell division protein FtsB